MIPKAAELDGACSTKHPATAFLQFIGYIYILCECFAAKPQSFDKTDLTDRPTTTCN